jgi:hypothetical protein
MKVMVGPMRSTQARNFRSFLSVHSILSERIDHSNDASVIVHVPPKMNESTVRRLWDKLGYKSAVFFTIIE